MIEICIPRLGWSMEEGTFIGWLKKSGDIVKVGDPLFELEGEKALQVIEAIDGGILQIDETGPKPGDVLPVGKVIGFIQSDAADFREQEVTNKEAQIVSPLPPPAGPSVRRFAREVAVTIDDVIGTGPRGRITRDDVATVAAQRAHQPCSSAASPLTAAREVDRVRATPRARRAAARMGVEWKGMKGTGRSGRIRESDIIAAAQPKQSHQQPVNHRSTIAARLRFSQQQTIPVTLHSRADATNLVMLRDQFKRMEINATPSYTDIIACLAAQILLEHPKMCVRWNPQQQNLEPISADRLHVGIAVDTDAGLVVAVLKNAAQRNVLDITVSSKDLIVRARSNQLSAEEMQGGTITLSNLGAYGIDNFTPVINYPEISILGLGAIRLEPTATSDGRIELRHQMALSLTIDHAAVDGAPAAAFLQALVRAIENPAAHLIYHASDTLNALSIDDQR